MTEQIEKLIRMSMAKDVEIKMLDRILEGTVITEKVVKEILKELTS